MASPTPSSLLDAKRQAVVDHVLAAARRLVLAKGLDTTMDQIADAAGVSRRTLFRHFSSRERLIAAAFEAGMANYSEQMPRYDGDLDRWLRVTCETAHRMNAVIGPGFFELTSRRDLAPELAAVERRRRRDFRGLVADVAHTLWRAAGGSGEDPEALVVAVSGYLSPHFTAAVMIDAGQRWQSAAELAHAAISAALDHEVVQRRKRRSNPR